MWNARSGNATTVRGPHENRIPAALHLYVALLGFNQRVQARDHAVAALEVDPPRQHQKTRPLDHPKDWLVQINSWGLEEVNVVVVLVNTKIWGQSMTLRIDAVQRSWGLKESMPLLPLLVVVLVGSP